MSEIVTSLIDGGLTIDFLHEHPYVEFQAFPQMTKGEDGRWHLPGDRLPMMFSIRAWKPL